MKAPMSSHFMPGDYIKIKKNQHTGEVKQIISITNAKVGVHFNNYTASYIRMCDVVLIPLSVEFFLNNGYKVSMSPYIESYERDYEYSYQNKSYTLHVKANKLLNNLDNNCFFIELNSSSGDTIKLNNVKYVHDFQHMLRMIGFSMEANNLNFEDSTFEEQIQPTEKNN